MKFVKRLISLLKPYHGQIKTILVMSLIFEVFKLINPYVFKEVIDALIDFDSSSIVYLVQLVVLMFVANVLVGWYYRRIDIKRFDFLLDVLRYLPKIAHQKLVALSLEYHQRENTGNKINRIIRGVDRIEDLLTAMIWDAFPTIFQFVVTVVVIAILDWQLALVFAVFIPAVLLMTAKINTILRPWREEVNFDQEESSGLIGQSIINIKTVQSFVQENYEVKQNNRLLDRIHAGQKKIWRTRLNFNFRRNLLLDLGRVVVLGLGIYHTYIGIITPGTLVLFLTLSEKVFISSQRLIRIFDRSVDSKEAVDRFTQLLAEESDIHSPAKPKKFSMGTIHFENVDFTYKAGAHALRTVDFEIKPGNTVALVGPSGAGKSTLVNLLYRHYDVTSGAVKINNVDIRDFNLFEYRKNLAIVSQDIDVFNDTVERNISYAAPEATRKQVIEAAKIANADEFIKQLPNGYDTLVGERGVKLSGGQRQRVGIARAILNNPKILVFDEATSQLDSESERLIQQAIARIAKRYTMIVIAHRLSTIARADAILVFDQGKIVEKGQHQDLKRSGGLYAYLHSLQQSGDVY